MDVIFAQTLTDPLPGWASIVLQGGSFGLLAYMVIKLMPASDIANRIERESRDKNSQGERELRDKNFKEDILRLMEIHDKSINKLQIEFREHLSQILIHCEKETQSLASLLGKDLDTLGKAVASLSTAVREFDRQRA